VVGEAKDEAAAASRETKKKTLGSRHAPQPVFPALVQVDLLQVQSGVEVIRDGWTRGHRGRGQGVQARVKRWNEMDICRFSQGRYYLGIWEGGIRVRRNRLTRLKADQRDAVSSPRRIWH